FSNLRAIGIVGRPCWLGLAVTRESRLTDLRQVAEQRFPLRVVSGDPATPEGAIVGRILAHYGLSLEQIEAWGGGLPRQNGPTANGVYQRDADAIIRNLYLASTPAARCWIDASVMLNLRFLDLPDNLIASLCNELGGEPGFVPHGYLRGVD